MAIDCPDCFPTCDLEVDQNIVTNISSQVMIKASRSFEWIVIL